METLERGVVALRDLEVFVEPRALGRVEVSEEALAQDVELERLFRVDLEVGGVDRVDDALVQLGVGRLGADHGHHGAFEFGVDAELVGATRRIEGKIDVPDLLSGRRLF